MASDEYIAAVAEIIRRAIELEATEHPELADIREHAEYWARYTLQVMLVVEDIAAKAIAQQSSPTITPIAKDDQQGWWIPSE